MSGSVYFGLWAAKRDPSSEGEHDYYGSGRSGLEKCFHILPLSAEIEILFAVYHEPWSYQGEAFVIGRKDGELFFVEGFHCSCSGLEGQWDPDPITPDDLRQMNEKGTQFDGLKTDDRKALTLLIDQLFDDPQSAELLASGDLAE